MAQLASMRTALSFASPDVLRSVGNRYVCPSCSAACMPIPSTSGSTFKRERLSRGAPKSYIGQGFRQGFGASGGAVSMALAVHHDGDPTTVNPSGLHETMLCNIAANEVFRDDDHGIACYETPLGEVVCEGFDDGPHFASKELPQAKRMAGALQSGLDQVKARAMKVRRALRETEPLEAAAFLADTDGSVCDGLDESSDCS